MNFVIKNFFFNWVYKINLKSKLFNYIDDSQKGEKILYTIFLNIDLCKTPWKNKQFFNFFTQFFKYSVKAHMPSLYFDPCAYDLKWDVGNRTCVMTGDSSSN